MGACTPASGRTPGMRRPVRTMTRPSICLRRIALGLPTSPEPSGVTVAALIPKPSSRRAAEASITDWLRVRRRSSSERSKFLVSTLNPSTPGSRSRSASLSSSSPVWSPCRTAIVATRLLDQAERNHHPELVGDAPVLDHLSVLEATNVDHVDHPALTGCRAPGETAQVGPATALTRPDLVAAHHEVFDRQREIGKRPPQGAGHPLHALGTVAHARSLVLH